MSNNAKKVVSIIGIIVGVIIVINGFCLQDTSNYSIGESIRFGADFYTEMYSVTKDVGRAINNAINDLICAISWLIISLGAINICFFVYKLVTVLIEESKGITAVITAPHDFEPVKDDEQEKEEKTEAEESTDCEVEKPNDLNDNSNVPPEALNTEVSLNQIKDDNFIYIQCKNCGKEFSFQKDMKKVRCPWCNAKQD